MPSNAVQSVQAQVAAEQAKVQSWQQQQQSEVESKLKIRRKQREAARIRTSTQQVLCRLKKG
jgi:hypothetical protein